MTDNNNEVGNNINVVTRDVPSEPQEILSELRSPLGVTKSRSPSSTGLQKNGVSLVPFRPIGADENGVHTGSETLNLRKIIDVYGNNFILFDNNIYSILLDGYYILSMSIVITSNFNKMLLYIKNKLNLHERSLINHYSLNLGYEENNNGVKLIKYFSYKIFELNNINIDNEQIFLNTKCNSIYVNKIYIKIKFDNYEKDNIIDDINNYNTSIILLRCKNK
jgi:hypothetical protein